MMETVLTTERGTLCPADLLLPRIGGPAARPALPAWRRRQEGVPPPETAPPDPEAATRNLAARQEAPGPVHGERANGVESACADWILKFFLPALPSTRRQGGFCLCPEPDPRYEPTVMFRGTIHTAAVLGAASSLFLAVLSSGCISQRTVTQNGRVVEQKPVITRPVRDTIRNSR
jgi:hypothetical protein